MTTPTKAENPSALAQVHREVTLTRLLRTAADAPLAQRSKQP